MARADAVIDLMGGDVEAGAELGFTGEELGAGVSGGFDVPNPLGTIGNRGLVIWGASAAILFLAWRAVKGY